MQINRVYFQTIESTNSWAKEHSSEFDRNALTVITADEQTGGRGRFRRKWISPKGCNLYVTYVFFLDELRENIGNLPQILAVAAYDSILPFSQDIKIKWPNDLVIKNKKVGGILCEITQSQESYAIIIGLGININMSEALLQTIDRPATSLMEACGMPLDREFLSEKVHQQFKNYLEVFLINGFKGYLNSFRKALIHKKGDVIRFSNFQEVFQGVYQQILPDGSLQLLMPDRSLCRFTSGELL